VRGKRVGESSNQAKIIISSIINIIYHHQTKTMLRENFIVPSNSSWSSPVVLFKKKGWEMAILRRLQLIKNNNIKRRLPFPGIDDGISGIDGWLYFSILDLLVGYWQVEVDEQDRAYFITTRGCIRI
jgi:putative transposase